MGTTTTSKPPPLAKKFIGKFCTGKETSGTAIVWTAAAARSSRQALASQPMADNYVLATDVICIRLHVFA